MRSQAHSNTCGIPAERVSFYYNPEETHKQIQNVGHSTKHAVCFLSKTVSREDIKRQGVALNWKGYSNQM